LAALRAGGTFFFGGIISLLGFEAFSGFNILHLTGSVWYGYLFVKGKVEEGGTMRRVHRRQ
jgi:hypothetical protein